MAALSSNLKWTWAGPGAGGGWGWLMTNGQLPIANN
jgi:hypothetical protein